MALSNGILDGCGTTFGAVTVNSDPWGYPGTNCLDGLTSTFWHTDSGTFPNWIKFDLGAGNAKPCGDYFIQSRDGGEHEPVNFKLQGSNNDSDWTDLDTQTGIGDWGSPPVKKIFPLNNPIPYRYYRLYITETLSTYCCLGEIGIAVLSMADLISLTEDVEEDSFMPGFVSGGYAYSLKAAYPTESVTLTATRSGATITYSYGEVSDKEVASGFGETIPLEVGENVVTIVSSAAGFAEATYVITITRTPERPSGHDYIADQLSDKAEQPITNIAIGTGSPTATLLGNEISRKVANVSRNGSKITYTSSWRIGDDISGDITEAALFSTGKGYSAVLDTKAFAAVPKTYKDPLNVVWEVEF